MTAARSIATTCARPLPRSASTSTMRCTNLAAPTSCTRAPDGQIEVAYPFSRRSTGHTVHLTGHLPVAAMCAIDALGIPLMTGADGVIDSTDPTTGTPDPHPPSRR